ncbi:alpha/beta fold hydrolase [Streptomyces sp. NPDC127114]|uniref:alpha/beta fold hydrolase n=1 Tax=Streptomyces sp. NPDC127114 TaxID=3345366 RepID=UPI00363CEC86
MELFTSYDGTTLAFRIVGEGPPLLCLPGGPGRAAAYLGDLGGLSAHRTLILPDTRGTGASAMPADLATCRVDRLVADVEALRRHLALDRVDLLGHSAGGSLAMLYAAGHPDRLNSLTLVAPSFAAVGLPSDTGAEEVIAARAAEPWHAEAVTAHGHMRTAKTFAEAAPHRFAFEPLMYGRWDDAARAHAAADPAQRSLPVSEHYYKDYTPDTDELRHRLNALPCPTLLIAGEVDLWPTARSAADAASLFPKVTLGVQRSAGHYPWLDGPQAFTTTVERFLSAADRTHSHSSGGSEEFVTAR